jgi:hypothetical protein
MERDRPVASFIPNGVAVNHQNRTLFQILINKQIQPPGASLLNRHPVKICKLIVYCYCLYPGSTESHLRCRSGRPLNYTHRFSFRKKARPIFENLAGLWL